MKKRERRGDKQKSSCRRTGDECSLHCGDVGDAGHGSGGMGRCEAKFKSPDGLGPGDRVGAANAICLPLGNPMQVSGSFFIFIFIFP